MAPAKKKKISKEKYELTLRQAKNLVKEGKENARKREVKHRFFRDEKGKRCFKYKYTGRTKSAKPSSQPEGTKSYTKSYTFYFELNGHNKASYHCLPISLFDI